MNNRLYHLIRFIVYVGLAICTIVFFDVFFDNIRLVVGGLMLTFGVEQLIILLINHRPIYSIFDTHELYLSFTEVIIGIVLLCATIGEEPTYAIWAIWSIIREALDLKEQVSLWKKKIPTVFSTIESIVIIVLSIILLVTLEEHHARIHLILLIVELFAASITPIIHIWYKWKLHK